MLYQQNCVSRYEVLDFTLLNIENGFETCLSRKGPTLIKRVGISSKPEGVTLKIRFGVGICFTSFAGTVEENL